MPNEENTEKHMIGVFFNSMCPCCKGNLKVEAELTFKQQIPDPIESNLKIKIDPYRAGNLLARIISASSLAKTKLNAFAPHLEFLKDVLTEVIHANEEILKKKAEEDVQS